MLHGTVSKNGTAIGRWEAKRTVTAPDGVHTYRWQAWTNDRLVAGDLQHQYTDGAMLLAQRVLVAAHAALNDRREWIATCDDHYLSLYWATMHLRGAVENRRPPVWKLCEYARGLPEACRSAAVREVLG